MKMKTFTNTVEVGGTEYDLSWSQDDPGVVEVGKLKYWSAALGPQGQSPALAAECRKFRDYCMLRTADIGCDRAKLSCFILRAMLTTGDGQATVQRAVEITDALIEEFFGS